MPSMRYHFALACPLSRHSHWRFRLVSSGGSGAVAASRSVFASVSSVDSDNADGNHKQSGAGDGFWTPLHWGVFHRDLSRSAEVARLDLSEACDGNVGSWPLIAMAPQLAASAVSPDVLGPDHR